MNIMEGMDASKGEEEVVESTEEKDQPVKPVNSAKEAHQEKEAELDAYLESLKPKPKRKSIKEMLMSLPAYKDLIAIKPKIGGNDGKKEDVIFLDVESNNRRKSRDLKRQQQIEALKDRFVKHCIPPPAKPGKGEHVKLKINKKEEDSQGIEHLVENVVDYVRNPLNEEEDAVLTPQQSNSPQALAPGANRRRLQDMLLGQIRVRKLKEHEERVKNFNMYNDEREDKSDNEEIVEDDELSENDSDVEDEEEEEDEIVKDDDPSEDDSEDDDEDNDENNDEDNDDELQQSDDLSLSTPIITNSDEMQLNSDVPTPLANIISEPKQRFDDLVDLCSGRFVSQANAGLSESQEEDEFRGFDFGDEDNEAIKNGTRDDFGDKVNETNRNSTGDYFEEKGKEASKKTNANDFTDIDNEACKKIYDDDDEIIRTRVKIKQKRLQFSDDEDEEEQPEKSHNDSQLEEQSLESEEEVEEQEPSPETVPEKPAPKGLFFNKHGLLKRKFVEDEAELSGSEEGSDDEDEKGLNYYEMEDGDDEEIDEDAVREQLERAHLKRMLDDDDARIRKIQDRYLENGDLHSDKQRERKFTWKNFDDLNDDAQFGDSDEEQLEDTPEEIAQKQAWMEKRKWLSENSHLVEGDEDTSRSLLSNSRFLKINKNTIKKLESFVDTSTSDSSNVILKETSYQRRSIYEEIIKSKSAARKSAVDLTSYSEGMNISSDTNDKSMSNLPMSQPAFGIGETTFKKGSFLSRGDVMLAKLAEGTKSADAVSNVKSNSRNFVFQHITPPNPQKTDGSTSKVKRVHAKSGNQVTAKKLKIDRSFSNLDEASKGASIFKWL